MSTLEEAVKDYIEAKNLSDYLDGLAPSDDFTKFEKGKGDPYLNYGFSQSLDCMVKVSSRFQCITQLDPNGPLDEYGRTPAPPGRYDIIWDKVLNEWVMDTEFIPYSERYRRISQPDPQGPLDEYGRTPAPPGRDDIYWNKKINEWVVNTEYDRNSIASTSISIIDDIDNIYDIDDIDDIDDIIKFIRKSIAENVSDSIVDNASESMEENASKSMTDIASEQDKMIKMEDVD